MRTKAPRTARINKQNMYYSLYGGTHPVYERDENGDIIYITVDGIESPVEAGTQEASYTTPVPFTANIDSELNEMHMKAWGIDQTGIYSEIVCQKNYLPLTVGAIIWRTSEITYDDVPDLTLEDSAGNLVVDSNRALMNADTKRVVPHQASADYTVVGIRTEGLTEDWYLLQKNSSDSHV